MTRFMAISAVIAGLLSTPVFAAEQTKGVVLAFDRLERIVILTDKTVWRLPAEIEIPADLVHGDRVHFEYESEGEDGISEITAMTRLPTIAGQETDG